MLRHETTTPFALLGAEAEDHRQPVDGLSLAVEGTFTLLLKFDTLKLSKTVIRIISLLN
jgi:hypothetical protein